MILNINVDYLRLVATDGHRLAKIDLTQPGGLIDLPGVIIPKKTIFELCKLLTDINEDIVINVDPNKIIFYLDNIILLSKLIDGNFPDYQRVIPQNNNKIVILEAFLSKYDKLPKKSLMIYYPKYYKLFI